MFRKPGCVPYRYIMVMLEIKYKFEIKLSYTGYYPTEFYCNVVTQATADWVIKRPQSHDGEDSYFSPPSVQLEVKGLS